jgi:hypothetical protein
MYVTQGDNVQRPPPSGPRGWLVGQLLSRFRPKLLGHVSTQEGKGRAHWLASDVARSAGRHLASYHLGQVGGAPPWPDKYYPTGESRHIDHILEIPLAKLS